jgi:hypothetical protein
VQNTHYRDILPSGATNSGRKSATRIYGRSLAREPPAPQTGDSVARFAVKGALSLCFNGIVTGALTFYARFGMVGKVFF